MGEYSYDREPGDPLRAPHAVRRILDGDVSIASFEYDSVGNMTRRDGSGVEGGFELLEYTSFNLPRRIVVGNGTSEVRYGYDASQRRVLTRIESDIDPEPEDQRIYVGDLYERQDTQDEFGPVTRHLYKVFAASGQVAQLEREVRANTLAAESRRYIHANHQGSSQLITKEDGDVAHLQQFDAFGKLIDGASASSDGPTRNIRSGYTGHETDSETGLVNMRGRVYDAHLARFLQADPIVRPGWSQNLNRYTYVNNNPLNAVDPTGFGEHHATDPTETPEDFGDEFSQDQEPEEGGSAPAEAPPQAEAAGGESTGEDRSKAEFPLQPIPVGVASFPIDPPKPNPVSAGSPAMLGPYHGRPSGPFGPRDGPAPTASNGGEGAGQRGGQADTTQAGSEPGCEAGQGEGAQAQVQDGEDVASPSGNELSRGAGRMRLRNAPHPEVNEKLPDSGPGYSSKPGSVDADRHWGLPELVFGIEEAGRRWEKKHPDGPRFFVGDMSKRGGGPISPHKAHDKGNDADIAAIPTSGEGYRVTEVGDANYSAALTADLIKTFAEVFGDKLQVVWFADPNTGVSKVEHSTATGQAHTFHFHIRIKP